MRAGARQHCLSRLDYLRGLVERTIVGHGCRINSYSVVEDSILFDGVDVGRRARIRRAIIDKGVRIPPGVRIGYDHDEDRERGFAMSERGVVVIAKAANSEQLFETPVAVPRSG